MKTEYLLYGVLPNERLETLLVVRDTEEELRPFVGLAKSKGITGIRIHKCELGGMPDFAGAVRV